MICLYPVNIICLYRVNIICLYWVNIICQQLKLVSDKPAHEAPPVAGFSKCVGDPLTAFGSFLLFDQVAVSCTYSISILNFMFILYVKKISY